jgi:hypothetical protein
MIFRWKQFVNQRKAFFTVRLAVPSVSVFVLRGPEGLVAVASENNWDVIPADRQEASGRKSRDAQE